MSVLDVTALAAERGTPLRLTDHAPSDLAIYETDETEPLLLGFCGNRLFDYSRSRGSDPATFVRLVHQATLRFGAAHLSTRIHETARGPLHTVAVTWEQPGWRYAVELHARAGASQVVEAWDARETVCR